MFSLSLSKDQLRVEPGSAVTLAVTVHNRGTAADRFEIDVGGIDQEWLAIPVPTFILDPGEERSEKILIKPPRTADSKSGAYPFAVRVRSLESGESEEVPAVLDVEPFHLISLEADPKRNTATYLRKQATYHVTVINLGNTDQNLQMFADDPEDGCTYGFEHERVQLAPGQQRDIRLEVQPTHFPVVGSPRLFGFGVSARSVENPLLVANAQAQVERRPLITFTVLLITLVAVLIVGVWYALRPVPPRVVSFTSDRDEVMTGEEVTLQWETAHASSVTIVSSDGRTWDNRPASGMMVVPMNESARFTIYAHGDLHMTDAPLEVHVAVRQPPEVPPAIIESFTITPTQIFLGEAVMVRYRVLNAVRIQLQPDQISLPVGLDSFEFRPTQSGEHDMTLFAWNANDQPVTGGPVRIVVRERSLATILVFRAMFDGRPLGEREVEPLTPVTLEWHVTNAARIEIQPAIGTVGMERSSAEVIPEQTTTYTITAIDTAGNPATQQVTIRVRVPEPPPTEPPPD